MKKIWYYLPSIIFNLVETLVIFLIGKLLNLPTMHILIIFLNFAIFFLKKLFFIIFFGKIVAEILFESPVKYGVAELFLRE